MLQADEVEIHDTDSPPKRPSSHLSHHSTTTNDPHKQHHEHPAIPISHSRQATPNSAPTKKTSNNPFHVHHKISLIPENRRGELNLEYLVTLPGVLKITEMVRLQFFKTP